MPPRKTPSKKPVKKTAAKVAPKKTPVAKPMKAKAPAAKIAASKKAPTPKKAPAKKVASAKNNVVSLNLQERLRDAAVKALDDGKGEYIVCVDVRERSSFTDFLIIATGRSNRQVKALGDAVQKALLQSGAPKVRVEGLTQGDWGVVDGGDVVVHIFRPEVRAFYRLEEVWGLEPPLHDTFKSL